MKKLKSWCKIFDPYVFEYIHKWEYYKNDHGDGIVCKRCGRKQSCWDR